MKNKAILSLVIVLLICVSVFLINIIPKNNHKYSSQNEIYNAVDVKLVVTYTLSF